MFVFTLFSNLVTTIQQQAHLRVSVPEWMEQHRPFPSAGGTRLILDLTACGIRTAIVPNPFICYPLTDLPTHHYQVPQGLATVSFSHRNAQKSSRRVCLGSTGRRAKKQKVQARPWRMLSTGRWGRGPGKQGFLGSNMAGKIGLDTT